MKILLVDDHPLFRAGLALLLRNLRRDLVLFEADNTQDALAISLKNPDLNLCLLDINLQQENGLNVLAALKEVAENLAVVVVSASEDSSIVKACIDAGAMSFISKSDSPKRLAEALKFILAGKITLPSEMLEDYENEIKPDLSPRQKQVLLCLCRGLSTKSIARELVLSEHTIKDYISSIFQILKVKNRTEAVISASQLTLMDN